MAQGNIAQEQQYWDKQEDINALRSKYKGIPPWQVKSIDPAAYRLLYEQKAPAPRGVMDTNAATDFLGNLAWALGEELTLGATLGADIATKGAAKAAFGVQPWEEETWAGRIGAIAGQGVGFITGLGLLGKGAKAVSKGVGAGTKALTKGAGKKLRSETAETLTKLVGEQPDAVMRDFSEQLYQAGRKAIKDGTESAPESSSRIFRRGKKISQDPFDTFDLTGAIEKNFDDILLDNIKKNPSFGDDVARNILDPVNADMRKELRDNVLGVSREYTSENLPKILSLKARQWGLGDKGSQIAGDMAYESTLFGIHSGLRNITERSTASLLNIDDEHYGRRAFASDVLHGMAMGASLAPMRYIPGGARVEVDLTKGLGGIRSGIMANVKNMGASITRKWTGKKAKDYTPKQLQTMLRNVYHGSNRNTEFFRGVDGWTPRLVEDVRMLNSKSNVKVLEKAYDRVSKDISKNLLPMLSREVGRDLFESAPRYIAGSLVMNAPHWYLDSDHMTADKVITDFIVGAFYMKRGKTLEGKPAAPRFLGNKDITGDEIARISRAFDALGWDKGQLDFMGGAWDKIYEDHMLASNLVQQGNKSIPDLRNASSILDRDMIPVTQAVEMQQSDPRLRSWSEQVALDYTKKLAEASDLRAAGRENEARSVEIAASSLREKAETAQILINELNVGIADKQVRPMSVEESFEFVDKVSNIEINGKKLTHDNVVHELSKLRKAASFQVTAQLQLAMEDYIKNSLNTFGLWDESMQVDGTIRVHPSVRKMLMQKIASHEKLGDYAQSAMTLKDVLSRAIEAGVVVESEGALAWVGEGNQRFSVEKLQRFNDEYRINTERLHDLAMGTENSGWRDLVPGKRASDAFMNPHILAADPVWHAIQTNMFHLRNDVGLQILTGKGTQGTEQIYAINEKLENEIFKGARRISLVDEESIRTIGDKPHLINLKNNLNTAWDIANTTGNKGTREIRISELESLHEDLYREVGNIFTDNTSFDAFKTYLDKNFVDNILGADASYGAKKAITNLIQEGNPISFTDPISGRKMIASGKALLDQILGSDYGMEMQAADPVFVSTVRDMVSRYVKEVQNVAGNKGGYIEFSDNIGIDISSQHTAKDWYQSLLGIDTMLDGSKIMDITRIVENMHSLEAMNSSFGTSAHFEKLASVATEKSTIDDLRTSLDNLRTTTRQLSYIINDAIQNNDFLLIREIVDSQYDIQRAISRAQQFTVEGKGSLEEVSQTLYKVSMSAISERNRKLSLDSIESVDEFIKRQEEVVTRQDRSGKPVLESQTISESQYMSRYGIDKISLDLIKGDIIAFSDAPHDLATEVASFINRYPVLKEMPKGVTKDLMEHLDKLGIPAQEYVRDIVKPWIDTQWTKISAKDKAIEYDKFLSDTAQLLVSSWAQKKVSMANYENGNLRITTKAVTNWDSGFLGIMKKLNLENKPNSIMLLGETSIGGNHVVTKLSDNMIKEINSRLAVGASPKIARSEQYSANERAELEKVLADMPLVGEGADGRPQFQIFRLDEKQAIVVSTNAYHNIVNQWRTKQGPLFQELSSIVGETKATKYLKDKLKVSEFKTDQIDAQSFDTKTVEGLLLLTRLMNDNAYYLHKLVNNEMSSPEIFKALKYIKLSNPRGGITLNNRTVDIMRYFTSEIMPKTARYKEMKRHFDSQMDKPHKQLTIYDESDPTGRGDSFFSSDAEYRIRVKKQLMDERGYDEVTATEKANDLADKLKPEAKSKVDGEIYVSLPEMVALLVSRGADQSWFVWDRNKIAGVNVVIKPVVSQNTVDRSTGAISVVVDKTAYKFDPAMDAAMRNPDGTYFTDSIAFKSANKVNQSRANSDAPFTENVISLQRPRDIAKPWKPQVALDIQNTARTPGSDLKLVDIDRANMMIKSLSGPHDGTLSLAFGNFLSNPAQDVMNSWLRSSEVVGDLNQHILDLWSNPFAFKAVAEKLKNFDKERGDITASLTGLEAVLAEGGIPIFEHMRPQIERALVGNYLGSRNFVSGQISNGAYNVMTAGDGMSLPIREGGIQKRFGGSGVPYIEHNKPIRDMLYSTEGAQSISLIFRLSESQAKNLNTLFKTSPQWKINKLKAPEVEIFQAGEEIVVSGDGTVSGAFDGYIQRLYNYSLDAGYQAGSRGAIVSREAAREIVINSSGKDYKSIIKEAFDAKYADGNPSVETLGDLVRFVDGKVITANNKQKPKTYFEDYTVKEGKGSMSSKYGYGSVRVADVNLRTPKDGINSWVITGIEKLIDRRKGAVSEMNSSDLINPQDADFDLDKSASFFAVPGPIVREIHSASGYHEISSEQIWDKALAEVAYEQPRIAGYVNELRKLEASRPTLVRQHSITSLMYQYFTSLDGLAQNNIIRPGYETGVHRDKLGVDRISQSTSGVNVIADFQASNRKGYQIMFRHGAEFVDAIGHMKKLIKHTIDVYGDLTKLNDRDLVDAFWFSDKVGLFKVVPVDKMGTPGEEVSWNSSIPEIYEFRKDITSGLLRPLNGIFNIALGYETLSNGTTRQLGFYDNISTFNRAKYKIWQLGQDKKVLNPFVNEFLGFLGERPLKGGTSNHPLIDGLIKMTEAYERHFPFRIERGNELANMLNGAAMDHKSVRIQEAVNKYMQDERNWVRFSSVQWEINRLEDILGDMRSRRQHETSQYKNMADRREMLVDVMSKIEVIANKKTVAGYNPRNKSGFIPEADAEYAVYKLKDGDVVNVNRVNKGQQLAWDKGDIVVKNPRVFRFSDPIQQKHLRTMHRAFGNILPGVEAFDVTDTRGYIRGKLEDVQSKFYDIGREFSDASVKNNSFYSDLYTTKLEILKSSFDDIMATRGPEYAKQFLHSLLTPKISDNEMSILNYDNKNSSYFTGFRFRGNKNNEQLVIRFMVAAMDGKVPGFSDRIAREWWSEMENFRKISYLMTHDKSLSGDAFKIGNLNRGIIKPTLNVLPDMEVKPRLLDVKTNNEQARKMIQSYLTGSYFLDPIELYRLTVGLDKTMNELPNPQAISERVKWFWEDVGANASRIEVREDMGRTVYRLSKSPLRNGISGNREHMRRKSFSEKILEEINCQ